MKYEGGCVFFPEAGVVTQINLIDIERKGKRNRAEIGENHQTHSQVFVIAQHIPTTLHRVAELEKKAGMDIDEMLKSLDEYKRVIIREQVRLSSANISPE